MPRRAALRIIIVALALFGTTAAVMLIESREPNMVGAVGPLPGTGEKIGYLPSPDFSDKILHYQAYLVVPESTGPNDRFLADVWLYFDNTNKPTYQHAVTTHNGDFAQAVFHDFEERTTTTVDHTRFVEQASPPVCTLTGEISGERFESFQQSGIPKFTTEDLVTDAGYEPSAIVLDTVTLADQNQLGQPEEILRSATFQSYERTADETRTVVQIDSETGRIIGWAVFRDGVKTYEQLLTSVEIYPGNSSAKPLLTPDALEVECK